MDRKAARWFRRRQPCRPYGRHADAGCDPPHQCRGVAINALPAAGVTLPGYRSRRLPAANTARHDPVAWRVDMACRPVTSTPDRGENHMHERRSTRRRSSQWAPAMGTTDEECRRRPQYRPQSSRSVPLAAVRNCTGSADNGADPDLEARVISEAWSRASRTRRSTDAVPANNKCGAHHSRVERLLRDHDATECTRRRRSPARQ